MTSEVVANALLYATRPLTFGVNCGSDVVHVEVGDGNRQHPVLSTADGSAEGGRGLLLVNALASAWGVTDTPAGKLVWFEVDAQP